MGTAAETARAREEIRSLFTALAELHACGLVLASHSPSHFMRFSGGVWKLIAPSALRPVGHASPARLGAGSAAASCYLPPELAAAALVLGGDRSVPLHPSANVFGGALIGVIAGGATVALVALGWYLIRRRRRKEEERRSFPAGVAHPEREVKSAGSLGIARSATSRLFDQLSAASRATYKARGLSDGVNIVKLEVGAAEKPLPPQAARPSSSGSGSADDGRGVAPEDVRMTLPEMTTSFSTSFKGVITDTI